MNTVPLNSLFQVIYGSNLALNALTKSESGINFVSRTSKNNGVSANVELIKDKKPIIPEGNGYISVACGGSVLSSFLQVKPFYSGRDLVYLKPKAELTRNQLLFYCVAIKKNDFKYGFGRQANSTLGEILLPAPDELPEWVENPNVSIPERLNDSISNTPVSLPPTSEWGEFLYGDIFEASRGEHIPKAQILPGSTPYISTSAQNNGVFKLIDIDPNFKGGQITLASDGSIGEAFWQEESFVASNIVIVLKPKAVINKYIGLFLCQLIRLEKPKYGYGRKMGSERFLSSKVRLPIDANGQPDWQLMEDYIKSLPYSASI